MLPFFDVLKCLEKIAYKQFWARMRKWKGEFGVPASFGLLYPPTKYRLHHSWKNHQKEICLSMEFHLLFLVREDDQNN
jgi:hypothetical protein